MHYVLIEFSIFSSVGINTIECMTENTNLDMCIKGREQGS